MKYAQRTKFGDIAAEFLLPAPHTGGKLKKRRARGGSRGRAPARVAIICPGMPGMPPRAALLEFLSKKGFWCFAIRYRGTWESDGKFLARSPEDDIQIVMDGLARGFKDAFTGKRYRIRKPEIYLFGVSFGGPAAILNSRDRRVRLAVVASPVVDWKARSGEPLPWLEKFVKRAFGEAYRFTHKDWTKLQSGSFYNPVAHEKAIDGEKIIIIHAKDDKIVPFGPVQRFSARTKASLVLFRRGGHLSSSAFMKHAVWRELKKKLTGHAEKRKTKIAR